MPDNKKQKFSPEHSEEDSYSSLGVPSESGPEAEDNESRKQFETGDADAYSEDEDLGIKSLEGVKTSVEKYLLSSLTYSPGPIFLDQASLEEEESEPTSNDDLDFMVLGELTGNKSTVTLYRQQHIEAVIKNAPDKKALYKYVYDLPESETTMKLAVESETTLDIPSMKMALRGWAFDKKEEFMAKYKSDAATIKEVDEWLSEAKTAKADILNKLDEVKSVMESRVANLALAVACVFLGNGRYVNHKLFLSGIKSKSVVQRVAFVLSEDAYLASIIKPSLVREKVYDVVFDHDFQVPTSKDSFRLERLPRTFGQFRVLRVRCRRMPSPQKYFEQCFLNPDDEVLEWTQKDTSEEYMEAEVTVSLGSMALIPHRATNERWQKNAARAFEASNEVRLMDNLIEALKDHGDFDREYRQCEKYWEGEKRELKTGFEPNEDLVAARQPLEDPWDMSCDILC